MQTNDFGNTGLKVTALGFGAMHLNDARVSEDAAARLLNEVLDLGVNLIDTARGYGLSEERIGRHIAHRRQDYVLSTKVGYGIAGVPDWTYACIIAGVDAALARMRCEVLDIVHLHSCAQEILAQGEVITALEHCQRAGKLRVVAYSGDNEALDWALQSHRFGAVQTSINLCDQQSIAQRLGQLQQSGIGVIAKRPVAGSVWHSPQRPQGHCESHYWDRWQAMGLDPQGLDWNELALRFTAYLPGVASCIVGTAKLEHFKQNIAALDRGALDPALQRQIREAFVRHDDQWIGMT
jgi:aryl-alcohol dehydrogenase-like predicted oxidoreductase